LGTSLNSLKLVDAILNYHLLIQNIQGTLWLKLNFLKATIVNFFNIFFGNHFKCIEYAKLSWLTFIFFDFLFCAFLSHHLLDCLLCLIPIENELNIIFDILLLWKFRTLNKLLTIFNTTVLIWWIVIHVRKSWCDFWNLFILISS
jgi:hypothetical protein